MPHSPNHSLTPDQRRREITSILALGVSGSPLAASRCRWSSVRRMRLPRAVRVSFKTRFSSIRKPICASRKLYPRRLSTITPSQFGILGLSRLGIGQVLRSGLGAAELDAQRGRCGHTCPVGLGK